MERLTSYKSTCKREMICRYEDCDTCEEYCPYLNEDNCPCLQEALEKLGKYEDFEEIFRSKMTDAACELLSDKEEFAKWLDRNKWIAKKCDEYARAEEQGKLLKLPCVPGQPVWKIKNGKISKWVVGRIMIEEVGIFFCNATYICGLSDFGKTVFLTKEEAEAALNGGHDE